MSNEAQKRCVSRIFVRLPAWVTLEARADEHVAFVRDISPRGIFFYSDFTPSPGDRIELVLQYLSGANKARLHLHGTVVRLEQVQASAVGIAVAFDTLHSEVPQLVRSGPKR
jgi:hypothetical protein